MKFIYRNVLFGWHFLFKFLGVVVATAAAADVHMNSLFLRRSKNCFHSFFGRCCCCYTFYDGIMRVRDDDDLPAHTHITNYHNLNFVN